MPITKHRPLFIILLLALSLVVACSAPDAPTPTGRTAPTTVAETPQSTVTAAPTETPTETSSDPATPTPAAQENPLSDTYWMLVSFGTRGEETLVLPDSNITLQFEDTGEAGGSGGCNSYGADYEVRDGTLSFSPIVSTMMACTDEDLMDQEQRYLDALQAGGGFELAAETLTIQVGEGQRLLNFVAQSAQPEPDGGPEEAQDIEISRVAMFSSIEGWATGRRGEATMDQILVTSDGGERWQVVTPEAIPSSAIELSPDLRAATHFASPQRAWVAYARPQPAAETNAPRVWLTMDGGQSWQSSAPLDLGHLPFEFFAPSDLGFIDGSFGWLMAHLGAGMSHDYIAIFTTEDGGQHWQRVADPDNNPVIQSCNKSGLIFTSPQEAWLAGNCPGLMPSLFLYHTTDGGTTWTQTELPAPDALLPSANGALGERCGIPQLALLPNQTTVLTLRCFDFEEESSQAWLYTTADGDVSWQIQTLPEPAGVFTFLEASEGWYLAADDSQPEQNSRIYHTMDGGDSWTTLAQIVGLGQPQIQFTDTMNGWIATGYPPERSLWRSADGGLTWNELEAVVILP